MHATLPSEAVLTRIAARLASMTDTTAALEAVAGDFSFKADVILPRIVSHIC